MHMQESYKFCDVTPLQQVEDSSRMAEREGRPGRTVFMDQSMNRYTLLLVGLDLGPFSFIHTLPYFFGWNGLFLFHLISYEWVN
jgi:hypothetical protein